MFERLKQALSGFASAIREKVETKEVRPEDLEGPLEDLVLNLVEAGVAYDVASAIADSVRASLTGSRVPRGTDIATLARDAIIGAIAESLGGPAPDIVRAAKERCSSGRPYVIAFFGVNGVGKTTTIAKVAKYLVDRGISVLIAAADTFRAGAQEQLKVHAEKLGVPFIGGSYGSDPASVAYNAINMAARRGICAVLLDTAGRMHADVDLMNELKKLVRVARPDLKVLVVDSLTGSDAVEQARTFNESVGVDTVIVTKVDADVKGGTVVSVAATIRRPVLFLGTGQGYDDLEPVEPSEFAKGLIG